VYRDDGKFKEKMVHPRGHVVEIYSTTERGLTELLLRKMNQGFRAYREPSSAAFDATLAGVEFEIVKEEEASVVAAEPEPEPEPEPEAKPKKPRGRK